jgi:hypothetical protein
MPNPEHRIIKLVIECVEFPQHDWGGHTEIWIGIQRGKEVVQRVQLPAETAVFDAELRVPIGSSEVIPDFLGPYAQGATQGRFVYLCWGRPVGGQWVGFRRAKLPLSGLTWESLDSNRIRAVIHCTDAKGGPICATLKGSHVTWSTPTE